MRRNSPLILSMAFTLVAGLPAAGCAKKDTAAVPVAEVGTPVPAGDGKIPITTASADAKAEFLQGRDLAEKLQVTDAYQHYQKAASLDPHFAWAELSIAASAPTGKEFFEHLNKAVALADKASNGERLLILAAQSGANNDAVKQKEHLEGLVAAYPNDERAHFNLGGFYFGQQDYPKAIEHYRKATELAPAYSTAFNILGYAYRQSGDYANAEKAFQKYIELIPKDPNPYDSYAELLLKIGRYDESIAQYRKALAIEPNFVNAHQGIAMDLLYSGKPDQAVAELAELSKKARNDGEKRTAMFARTIVYLDGGNLAKAAADVDAQYALGKTTNDVPAMAFDRGLKGNILLAMGKADAAKTEFDEGVKLVEGSTLSAEVKENAKLAHHYNLARVALAKKDVAGAKKEAEEFRKGSASSKNPFQVKNVHELDGIVALAEKDYDKAIAELEQANQQNPQDLYRLCQAWQGKGDQAKGADFCRQAAEFNSLPNQNYAFVRTKAKAGAGKKAV
ncbi:MAG: tetratricopeptide repeat protein [Thermoanaerobaculia bacterium]|nr:tetratricopeptide repeat protein [Acidobacteriota bacterium]